MSFGTSPIERDQRERGIVVDNAFRPGKGSRPRPLAISKDELGKRLTAIFGWSTRRKQRAKGGQQKRTRRAPATRGERRPRVEKRPFPGIIP